MIASLLCALLSSPPQAIVLTNNRSARSERPDLRYADDDGAQWADLFAERFGEDAVQLLTEFDPESRRLYSRWKPDPPTKSAFFAAIDRAVARDPAEVYLVIAAHGDVAGGQGYVDLAGERLTAADLDRALSAFGGRRVHLVIDSCNSYFMLNPRKPGGRRFERTNKDEIELLKKHPNTGALISTSAEAVTYEWSELQSGIFSYELRSALRGAADANGDGAISYQEAAGFLAVANRPIVNELYRPKVFSRAPSPDAPLFVLGERPSLLVGAEGTRRLTIRDRDGVRILDLHKEDGVAVALHLPKLGALTIYETLERSPRPQIVARVLSSTASVDLAGLSPEDPPIAPRGEAPVFERLFREPFGPRVLSELEEEPRAQEIYGVSRDHAERLGLILKTAAEIERDQRTRAGFSALGLGAAAAILGAAQLGDETQRDRKILLGATLGLSGALMAIGTGALIVPSASEDTFEDFSSRDLEDAASRARAVIDAEAQMQALSADYARTRTWLGVGSLVLGAGFAAVGAISLAGSEGRGSDWALAGSYAAGASVFTALGLWSLLSDARYPVERAWALYGEESDLSAVIAPIDGGAAFGLSGRF